MQSRKRAVKMRKMNGISDLPILLREKQIYHRN